VPVLRLGHLSSVQVWALRLANNRIALNASWNEALLVAEIARIRDDAIVDLGMLGFSGMELDRHLGAEEALLACLQPELGRHDAFSHLWWYGVISSAIKRRTESAPCRR